MAKTRKVNKSRKLSPWIQLVTKTFNENKHKAGYAFKDAIQDAKKVYTKVSGKVNDAVNKVKKGVTKANKKDSDQKGKGASPNKTKSIWDSVFGQRKKKRNQI
jgi:hypothetical protein